VLPPRNAVGRDSLSLAPRLTGDTRSASPHGAGPLSEDLNPSTRPARVRKFGRPEIVHDSYRAIRNAGAIEGCGRNQPARFAPPGRGIVEQNVAKGSGWSVRQLDVPS
jgi:hypothetical protein